MSVTITLPVSSSPTFLTAGVLCLDTTNHRVTLNSIDIGITPKAFIVIEISDAASWRHRQLGAAAARIMVLGSNRTCADPRG